MEPEKLWLSKQWMIYKKEHFSESSVIFHYVYKPNFRHKKILRIKNFFIYFFSNDKFCLLNVVWNVALRQFFIFIYICILFFNLKIWNLKILFMQISHYFLQKEILKTHQTLIPFFASRHNPSRMHRAQFTLWEEFKYWTHVFF